MTTLSLYSGQTLQLQATVKNVHGQKLNFSVIWHTSNPASITVSQTGLVTATSVAGSANVFATIGNKSSPITTIVNLGPPIPTPVLTSYSVTPDTLAPVANAIDNLTVQALDQFGHPFNQAGISVNFSILTGTGGSLSASSGVTNASGTIVIVLTVGTSQIYQVKAIDNAGKNGTSASIIAGASQPIPPPLPPPPPPPDTTPASITLTNGNFTLGRGETQPIRAVVKNAGGTVLTTPVLVYHSATPANVTIDSSTGIVTGVGAGTSVITATLASPSLTSNSLTLTCTGLPDNTPAFISIPNSPFSGFQGDTDQLSAIVKNAENGVLNGQTIIWASDAPLVATIDSASGLVTIQAVIGTANITAKVGALTSAALVITGEGPVIPPPVPPPPPPVTPPPSQPPPSTENVPAIILITGPFLTLNIGQFEQLTSKIENAGGNLILPLVNPDNWTSSNPSVVSVDLNGVITGKSAGVANIVASYGALNSSALPITVSAPDTTPASVSIAPSGISLTVGGSQTLVPTIKNAAGVILNVNPTSWSSDNTGVATVDINGVVKFVAAGTCNVVAHSTSLTSNICIVTCVAAPPTSGTTFAATNFASGVIGTHFSNPWGFGMSIKPDPTNSGKGNVLDIEYANNPPGNVDSNLALFIVDPPIIGLGQEIWFKGSYYINNTIDAMRKLFIWGTDVPGLANIITLQPGEGPGANQLQFTPNQLHPEWVVYTNVFPTTHAWHELKVQMIVNTVVGILDGIMNAWLDGILVYSRNTLAWIEDPNSVGFTGFGTGYQMQSSNLIDEHRYWTDFSFASKESALK